MSSIPGDVRYGNAERRRDENWLQIAPDNVPTSNFAEWHITYRCDLACTNCSRLCFLPPTTPDMTPDDAREFVRQPRELNWSPAIVMMGGEPTLHPQLFEFLKIVNKLSPGRVETDEDERALASYLGAIKQAQAMERQRVRRMAAAQFQNGRIVDQVIAALVKSLA